MISADKASAAVLSGASAYTLIMGSVFDLRRQTHFF